MWTLLYIYIWKIKGQPEEQGFSTSAPGPTDTEAIAAKKLRVIEIGSGEKPTVRVTVLADDGHVTWKKVAKIEPIIQHMPPKAAAKKPRKKKVAVAATEVLKAPEAVAPEEVPVVEEAGKPKKRMPKSGKPGRYSDLISFNAVWPDKDWQGDVFYTRYGNPDPKKNADLEEDDVLPEEEAEVELTENGMDDLPEDGTEIDLEDEEEEIEFETEEDDPNELNLDDDDDDEEEVEAKPRTSIRSRFTKTKRITDELEFEDDDNDEEEAGDENE